MTPKELAKCRRWVKNLPKYQPLKRTPIDDLIADQPLSEKDAGEKTLPEFLDRLCINCGHTRGQHNVHYGKLNQVVGECSTDNCCCISFEPVLERIKELKAELAHYKTKDSEAQATIVRQQAERNKLNRQIQSLTAKLEDARQGNRNLSARLGKAQKRASKVCAVKLKNQNKHLREQLKKVTKRYKELSVWIQTSDYNKLKEESGERITKLGKSRRKLAEAVSNEVSKSGTIEEIIKWSEE